MSLGRQAVYRLRQGAVTLDGTQNRNSAPFVALLVPLRAVVPESQSVTWKKPEDIMVVETGCPEGKPKKPELQAAQPDIWERDRGSQASQPDTQKRRKPDDP